MKARTPRVEPILNGLHRRIFEGGIEAVQKAGSSMREGSVHDSQEYEQRGE